MTSARCAREECGKMVYPMEELKCLDKSWHKKCFRCTTCGLALTLKTFKSHQKNPYCTAHYSKAMSTIEAPSKVSNPEETAKESEMHSDEKKSDKFPIENIQHCASNCSWDWDEQRLTGYGRDFLLPSDFYMKCLQTNDHSSMKPTRSLSKKRKNSWEALKAMGDLSHFDSCEESELRETCSLAYEMLFPSATHSDQQLARSIYDRIVPRLNALENGLLKAVQEARDKLCCRLLSADWKSALYTNYCEEVHSIAAKKDIRMDTLDDVCRLLKHPGGLAPQQGMRQGLDPKETTIVNNIAKAYALILDSVGKGKGLSGEFVRQINAQVYHGLSETEPEGKFTKGRGEVTLSMLGWLQHQMHSYKKKVDRVSLAALTYLAIYLIHTFQDGNTRTSQLVQSYILLESGYPPACIPAGKFNDYLELLGGIQGLGLRDPRQFVRFIIESLQHTIDQQLAKLSEDNVADVKRPDAHSAKEADGSSSSYLPPAICTEGKGPLIATLMREAIAEFNPALLHWDREAVDRACAAERRTAGGPGAGGFAQLFLEAIAEFNPDLLR